MSEKKSNWSSPNADGDTINVYESLQPEIVPLSSSARLGDAQVLFPLSTFRKVSIAVAGLGAFDNSESSIATLNIRTGCAKLLSLGRKAYPLIFCFSSRIDSMARLGRNGFLAIAVVFHLVYVYSIFDIYFVSPIVSGMTTQGLFAEKAPAKRLVLFVGKLMFNPVALRARADNYKAMVFEPTRLSSPFQIHLQRTQTTRMLSFLAH